MSALSAPTQQFYRLGQYPSTSSQNSGSRSSPPHTPRSRVSDSMASGFSQRLSESPSFDAQPYATDVYRYQPAVPTAGHTYGNDAYGLGGGSILGYDHNYAVAASWGPPPGPPPQPLHNSVYPMLSYPTIPYNNLGQGETNYAGYHFGAYQVPSPSMNFSPHVPQANANQGASHEWNFHTCWVSHAEQDEIHLTIALKKI